MTIFTQPLSLTAGSTGSKLLFEDTFTSLSLSNYVTGTTGTWQLGGRSYQAAGIADQSQGYDVNPFNPQTPFYTASLINGGGIQLKIMQTPSQYAAACDNMPYSCAWMSNRLTSTTQYGYYEANIAYNMIRGCNGSFWLQPSSGTWPPEIDAIEADYNAPSGGGLVYVHNVYSMDQSALSSFYDYDQSSGSGGSGSYTGKINMATYNSYGVNFQADYCTFYFNRVMTEKIATPSGYDQTMYIILSMEAGNDTTGPIVSNVGIPATMNVQYVRVWDTLPF